VIAVVIAARLGRRLFGTPDELRDPRLRHASAPGRATSTRAPLESSTAAAGGAPRDRLTRGAGERSGSGHEQEDDLPVAQPLS
jgi:hypothetical protein